MSSLVIIFLLIGAFVQADQVMLSCSTSTSCSGSKTNFGEGCFPLDSQYVSLKCVDGWTSMKSYAKTSAQCSGTEMSNLEGNTKICINLPSTYKGTILR